MYNRYLPQEEAYTPVSNTDSNAVQFQNPQQHNPSQASSEHFGALLSSLGNGFDLGKLKGILDKDKFGGMERLLSSLHLEDLDSGDILLILIILLVLVEGDNLELVITLGLMLLLSLGEQKQKSPEHDEPSGD